MSYQYSTVIAAKQVGLLGNDDVVDECTVQGLSDMPESIVRRVMLRAMTVLTVRDYKSLITHHFTTLTSLSAACHRVLAEPDIRHHFAHLLYRSKPNRKNLSLI